MWRFDLLFYSVSGLWIHSWHTTCDICWFLLNLTTNCEPNRIEAKATTTKLFHLSYYISQCNIDIIIMLCAEQLIQNCFQNMLIFCSEYLFIFWVWGTFVMVVIAYMISAYTFIFLIRFNFWLMEFKMYNRIFLIHAHKHIHLTYVPWDNDSVSAFIINQTKKIMIYSHVRIRVK